MTKTAEQKEVKSPLKNEVVEIHPIKRDNEWLPKNHEAHVLFKNAELELCAPWDEKTKKIINPLTPEEIEFFENKEYSSKHGFDFNQGDLSVNKKVNNVWHTGNAFTFALKNEITPLDLSQGKDYIIYKLLLVNKDIIAPDLDSGTEGNPKHKKTYKFKIIKQGEQLERKVKKINIEKKAWQLFGKIEHSTDKLKLVVMLDNPAKNSKINREVSKDSLVAEVDKIIEKSPKKFVDIVEDPFFDMKVIITKAMDLNIVFRKGSNIYANNGEDLLGVGLTDAAKNLENTDNQDLLIAIKKQMEAV